ncbi:transaldolase [Nocardia tenerifensis]|uniref:Transaldolase n=1 Tax=Nocardia tenerifensis TaxID=228006 RepID=A0A318JTE3_9NOCA|nr:transaldolase family protein [Nocardia tenerifensis]PXX54914.1 transaldolase [Nocardia tenerifensis]
MRALSDAIDPSEDTGNSTVLKRIQATHDDLELWWDSPLTEYETWASEYLAESANPEERSLRGQIIDEFFDPAADSSKKFLLRGVTTNPSLVSKSVLDHAAEWRSRISRLMADNDCTDTDQLLRLVQREVVARTARMLLPLWRSSGGRYGWVSAQTDPRYTLDADAMVEHGVYLADISPNVMVKIPGSMAGYEAMSQLVAQGISINNTLSYTVPQFTRLADIVNNQKRPAGHPWRAVITHMIGRYGASGTLDEQAKRRGLQMELDDIRWAEVAIVKHIQNTIQPLSPDVKMLLSSLQVDINPDTGRAQCPHIAETCGCSIVYTLKPDVVRSLIDTDYQKIDFLGHGMADPIPTSVHNRLMKLPYFRAAIDPEGLDEKEFHNHPSFVSTYEEILRNHSRLQDFVAHAVETARNGKTQIAV